MDKYMLICSSYDDDGHRVSHNFYADKEKMMKDALDVFNGIIRDADQGIQTYDLVKDAVKHDYEFENGYTCTNGSFTDTGVALTVGNDSYIWKFVDLAGNSPAEPEETLSGRKTRSLPKEVFGRRTNLAEWNAFDDAVNKGRTKYGEKHSTQYRYKMSSVKNGLAEIVKMRLEDANDEKK